MSSGSPVTSPWPRRVALALLAASIPLILFGGALFFGMASVIAFGLLVATILTLGFVPALYTLLFGISTRDALSAVTAAPMTKT